MDPATIDIAAIEKRLDEAIEYAQAQGYTLTPDVTLDRFHKTCCPLGALVIGDRRRFGPNRVFSYAKQALGIDIFSIVRGFDGNVPLISTHPDAYDLGCKYRARALGTGA